MARPVTLRCEECQKEFIRAAWVAARATHHFCSNACAGRATTWNNASRFRKPRALRLDPADAAWLAGLFDGEGYIIFPAEQQGNKRKEKARMGIKMTSREVISRVAEVT